VVTFEFSTHPFTSGDVAVLALLVCEAVAFTGVPVGVK
jgi:hypothetical protein